MLGTIHFTYMSAAQAPVNNAAPGPSAGIREAELRHLADLVPQMVWMCTPDGANVYFNQRWVNYTGLTLDESYGAGWTTPFHPDDKAAARLAWDHAVQTEGQYLIESRLRRADGTYRWFLMRGEPFKEAEGRVVKWCGTCTDIHEMKQAEQALLRREKLVSAGRMAASVAHEINNPLEAVTNLLYLAKTEHDLIVVREYVEKAEEELNRVAYVTRQALGFYRESTRPSPSSVQQLLESAIDILKAKITAKQACINPRWGDDVRLNIVAGELRQVFANLLANSLDAIHQQGTIKIRTSVAFDHARQERCFTVTIADNGRGIPSHLRSQIFEPFFTTKGSVGTGLGLWVSKQILDNHRGTIRIRSKANGKLTGTVIRLTFTENRLSSHRM